MIRTHKPTLLLSTALLSTAIGLGVASPAQAQSSSQAAPDPGDIIVTARRIEERLQDVPISIQVFNQEQLSRNNITNAQDLANITPSLSANTNYGSENSTFALRGFVQDNGTQPSVGVYFADVIAPVGSSNGVAAGNGAGPGMLFDLQNVQVLKGPQGTLFGRNTTGGNVLLVPQRPTDKLGGYLEGSIGNFDMRRIQGAINLPLSDTFLVRIAGDHQQRDGYLHNTSGIGPDDFNDVNYTALRLSVVANLTPNLENYTIASWSDSNTNGSVQKLITADVYNAQQGLLGTMAMAQVADQNAKGEGFYDVRSTVPDPVSRLTTWQVINTTKWLASDTLTIKNTVSYAELKDKLNSALFGTQFNLGALSPLLPFPLGFVDVLDAGALPLSHQSTFTEELQIQGHTGDNSLSYQGGIYYESSKPLGWGGTGNPILLSCSTLNPFNCTDPVGLIAGGPVGSVAYSLGKSSYRDIGLYAQGTYSLTEKLKLTLGARYTWDRQDTQSQLYSEYYANPLDPTSLGNFAIPASATNIWKCTIADAPADTCIQHLKQSSGKPTWLINLDYKPSPNVMVYGKYARGYRAGGIKPDMPTQFQIFQPEQVDSFEIGLKSSFHGAVSGTFNLAGFYNNFKNQQLQLGLDINNSYCGPLPAPSVGPTAGPVNAGKSRIFGLEADGSLKLGHGLSLNAAYTYLNTKILSANIPALGCTSPYELNSNFLAGDQLALSPKHKLVVTAAYTLPFDAWGPITVSATDTYTSSQRSSYSDRDPAFLAFNNGQDIGVIPAYNLLNANLDWKSVAGKPFDLGLFVTNLTKTQYYTYIPGLEGGSGFEVASIGAPRMYGLRLKVHM